MIAQSAASTRLTDPCELAHVKSVVGGGTYMWDRSQEASEQEQDAIVAPLRLQSHCHKLAGSCQEMAIPTQGQVGRYCLSKSFARETSGFVR